MNISKREPPARGTWFRARAHFRHERDLLHLYDFHFWYACGDAALLGGTFQRTRDRAATAEEMIAVRKCRDCLAVRTELAAAILRGVPGPGSEGRPRPVRGAGGLL